VPNITPHPDGLAEWSGSDMEFLLETGLMPNSSPVGSSMAAIIRGTSKLTADDRHAMAVYLRALPPRQGSKPEKNRLSATKRGWWTQFGADPAVPPTYSSSPVG
jgi:hypothetical protein